MTIKKKGSQHQLVSGTGKVLGTYPSKKAAVKQEQAIKISQHKKAKR